MFIDTQLDPITAPEEPNVAAVIDMALRWSAIPVEAGAINIWPRRGHKQHNTLLPPVQAGAALHMLMLIRLHLCHMHHARSVI